MLHTSVHWKLLKGFTKRNKKKDRNKKDFIEKIRKNNLCDSEKEI